jgi:class 3 adenylate cyclase/tetratricopeptide (TPR) repeat protein
VTDDARPAAANSPIACPTCGTPAVPGGRFCFNCGAPLERAEHADAAERRVVTVLFGDLTDFTAWAEELDPERVSTVVDRLLAALTAAVGDVDGYVDKLTGDGIMAVFGAPTAHEDDAERAVRAAAAMQDAVRRLIAGESGGGRSLGLRVGVNTGEVLAGVQAGLAYTVIGDTVNTAARLSDAAGVGAVWAGRETALATMAVASWRALPPLRLKGKREPVAAYELVRLRAPGADRPGLGEEAPFIGRDVERGALIGRALDVVDRQSPASVLIVGEAGIGKTRLVTEVARFVAEIDGSRVLWGRCTRYGEGRELHPVLDWVRTACGLGDAELLDAEEAAERVRRTVARIEATGPAPAVDPLLSLLALAGPEVPLPRDVVAPGTTTFRESAVEAVAMLVSGLARSGPLLLVVDDLQWASDALVDAVTGIARRVSGPVLLVFSGRSELLAPAGRRGWWQDLPAAELVPLTPLEPAAAERLLRAYLGGGQLEPDVREMLLDRSEGNPFFLAELIHLLVDRGLLRREAEGWALAGDLPVDVLPAGVQAVLAARLDDLDGSVRAIARVAAVIGSAFPDAAVVALHDNGSDNADVVEAVADALAVLRERDIVRAAEPGWHAFAHTLARDVAYAAIPKVDRAHLHAAVVEWAGATAPPMADLDAFIGLQAERALALAAEMSLPVTDPAWQVRDAGFRGLRRAAGRALLGDDPRRAIDLATRAIVVAGDALPSDAVLRVRVIRGSARAVLNELDAAEHDITDALVSDDSRLRAQALVVLGHIGRRRGSTDGAVELFEDALLLAREVGDHIVAGEALRELGLVDYLTGRFLAAEQRFDEAMTLAENAGDTRGAAWAMQHLAWSATTRGDYLLAESTLRRAADLFTTLGDERGLSWCAGSEAFVRMLEGRYETARELAGGLLPMAERIGDQWAMAACLTIDAFAAAELGDPETGREEAERARRIFDTLGEGWGLAMASTALGVAARCLGDTREAVGTLTSAQSIASTGGYAAVALFAAVVKGYAALDLGDVDTAQSAVDDATRVAGALDLEPHSALGIEVLSAQVLRARGELDAAMAVLAKVDANPETPSLLFPRRQALAHYAGLLLELGQVDEAASMVERAIDVPAEDVRSSVVALRVLAAVRCAQGRQPDAQDAMAAAYDYASSAGYRVEIALTERAAERLGLQLTIETP